MRDARAFGGYEPVRRRQPLGASSEPTVSDTLRARFGRSRGVWPWSPSRASAARRQGDRVSAPGKAGAIQPVKDPMQA